MTNSRNFDHREAYATPPVTNHPDRACNAPDVDPEIFFPPEKTSQPYVKARAVCHICAYRKPCLAWAIETRQAHGMWGGATPNERDRLAELGPEAWQ